MSIVIKINGVDKSSEIDYKSLRLKRALTNQVDTCQFMTRRADSSGYKPALLDDIKITENGTYVFGGLITEMSESVDGKLEYVECTAKDYAFDMDRNLVLNVYENMSVNDIINDIKTNVLPSGYTTTNVSCPVVITYIAFNWEYPSKCLQQLAQITGYDWYVDESKNIYFFASGTKNAPFNLTDTNQKYNYASLEINKNITNIRNTIIVRGGTYQGSTTTELQVADGSQTTFKQAYSYSNIVVKVNGVTKTVGIDNIDNPASYDCLYNFQEKAVKFPDASKPTTGQIVSIAGNPALPVITKVTDTASTSLYGTFEFKIVDKSIGSKEAARDRARAEITAWAQEVNEGTFDTFETGLEVGQKINVQSTIRGISQDFIISRISSKMDTPSRFKHTVTLVTSQTYGIVEFLQKLLISNDKQIVVNADEYIDFVEAFYDSMTFTDSIGTPTKTSPPYVYGTGVWGYSTWG